MLTKDEEMRRALAALVVAPIGNGCGSTTTTTNTPVVITIDPGTTAQGRGFCPAVSPNPANAIVAQPIIFTNSTGQAVTISLGISRGVVQSFATVNAGATSPQMFGEQPFSYGFTGCTDATGAINYYGNVDVTASKTASRGQ
jgi:hypothetical protein